MRGVLAGALVGALVGLAVGSAPALETEPPKYTIEVGPDVVPAAHPGASDLVGFRCLPGASGEWVETGRGRILACGCAEKK